uniref:Uncharacterized protein n=1 Tax=Timema genevievae TaxID=629358 RepID=A0A7R9KBW9_TIMGE|nr:unnamed protein product [Timema genevievae]
MKMELMSKALAHKPEKRYKIDEMVRECGHQVLRLPPYHCQYNSLELVWSKNVDHTEKIINDDWAREMKMDASENQPFIIQIGDNESDSDDDDDDEEVLAVPLLLD